MLTLLAMILLLGLQDLPTLQPFTCASPAGDWTLHVDPSAETGEGPAHVVVTRGARTAAPHPAWEADLAFTFWEAAITDTGYAAGYAYTAPHRGLVGRGEFVVAIFDPEGHAVLEQRTPIAMSPFLHCPDNPNAEGLFVQAELDRFVVRVSDEDVNRQDESWWTYSIPTGAALGRVQPKSLLNGPEKVRCSMDAQGVAGTPLTLARWHCFDPELPDDRDVSQLFVLHDADWKPVWSLNVTGGSENRILSVGEPGRFELLVGKPQERVRHEVAADPTAPRGWAVLEVERAPWVDPASKPAEFPMLALRELPTVLLEAGAPPAGPMHDVLAFDFDAQGRVIFVRGEPGGATAELLRLDRNGEVLSEAAFTDPSAEAKGWRHWHALSGGRWLFSFSPFGDGARSRAWFVDAASGVATEIEGFAGPSIEAVRPASDGGCVVLGHYAQKHTSNESLMALDAAGQRRWEIVQNGYEDKASDLLGCEDIAIDGSGEILVLSNIRRTVQVFSAGGEYQRTVALPEEWASEPCYPVALRVLHDGAWLVHDSIKDTWHRVSPKGESGGSFVAQWEDGSKEVGRPQLARLDASGALWSTDGSQLIALDADGVAHTRLGAAPVADVLEEPQRVYVDALGRVAVSDRRTHAVHLFDGAGRRTLVLRPEPKAFDGSFGWVDAVIAGTDGSTAVRYESNADRYARFAADGRPEGVGQLGGSSAIFVPGSGDRWVAGAEHGANVQLRRLSGEGLELVSRERRPGGEFFVDVRALGCAADSSVWVLSALKRFPAAVPVALDLFSPTGEPQRSVSLTAAPKGYWSSVALTPRWLLVSSFEDHALLVSLADGKVSRVRCDGVTERGCGFGFSPDGNELWCVLPDPLELHRFELPE